MREIPKVYICYPIRSSGELAMNKRIAYERAYNAIDLGFNVVLPHLWIDFKFFCDENDFEISEKYFLARDLIEIKECDVLYYTEADCKGSYGCLLEHEWAKLHNIPIAYCYGELKAFMAGWKEERNDSLR